MKLSMNS